MKTRTGDHLGNAANLSRAWGPPLDSQFILMITFYLITLFGVLLAICQFMLNRSLWLDEANLALNIVNRGFIELTQPLDHNQVAPIGFLFVERATTLVFGKNEPALRLFPLISFLASIPLLYLLSARLTKNRIVALLSTSLFSISSTILGYSCEVKQYSTDVLFTVILLNCSLGLKLNTNRSLFIYAITGSIAVWFSNTAIIILFVAGCYLLYSECYRNKNHKLLLPFLSWVMSFSVYFYFLIRDHPSRAAMVSYWEEAFLPLNPFSGEFYRFVLVATRDVYAFLLGVGPLWSVALLISLAGIGCIVRSRNYTLLYFVLAPIVLHLILSGMKLYPFSGRLILYTAPLIVLLFSIGLYHLFELTNKKLARVSNLILILPVLMMLYPAYRDVPMQNEEIRSSLEYMERNIKENDTIYVYYASRTAFEFYKDTGIIKLDNPVVVGTSNRGANHGYDHELANLEGNVWLLLSHVYQREEEYLVNRLVSKGATLLDLKKYRGSSVYYFDTRKPASAVR